MFNYRYALVAAVFALFVGFTPTPAPAADEVAPPAADETLIYLMRERRFAGGGAKMWIAVNDQTVARVKNKGHAIIRAKAGRITLNLATTGIVSGTIALDDRPGETVYLKWRLGDQVIREVDEAEGLKFLRKSKRTKPIDEIRPNNEELASLINLSRMGFDLMQPAGDVIEPNQDSAVITFFRRGDGKDFAFGVWGESEFIGTLAVHEGLSVRVPPGEHYFLAGNIGKTLLKADVEAGKRYYAWLDLGTWVGRVRLTPVARSESKNLEKWLDEVTWVDLAPDSITPRILERADMVTEFIGTAAERAAAGEADFHLLGSEHAY